MESKYLKSFSNGRIRFLVKYCGLKRLSFSVEAALTIEAEIATVIASDNIEMHLKSRSVSNRYLLPIFTAILVCQVVLCTMFYVLFWTFFRAAKLWVVV